MPSLINKWRVWINGYHIYYYNNTFNNSEFVKYNRHNQQIKNDRGKEISCVYYLKSKDEKKLKMTLFLRRSPKIWGQEGEKGIPH